MTELSTPVYRTVVLDVDSTLCGIEGIDWLAERRDVEIAKRIADETALAMRGELTVDAIYASRLETVAPTRDEVAVLGEVYMSALAPGAKEVIAKWIDAEIVVALVSGGFRQAIAPVAKMLGKRELVSGLDLPRPVVMVGDGSTDLTTRQVVDAFVAFTGFANREEITRQADFIASSFRELDDIVFGRV